LFPSSSAQDLAPDDEDLLGVEDAGMVAAGVGCADDCEDRAGWARAEALVAGFF
jgi:hypothetical protein